MVYCELLSNGYNSRVIHWNSQALTFSKYAFPATPGKTGTEACLVWCLVIAESYLTRPVKLT